MRLSNAIALGRVLVSNSVACGSTRIKAQPGDGCALDMAVLAAKGEGNWQDAKKIWNWIYPFPLYDGYAHDDAYYWKIIRMFDRKVATGEMSLDELIDWVRSVEPDEAADTDNLLQPTQTESRPVQDDVAQYVGQSLRA